MSDETARGRPRDPRIDDVVLAATRDILAGQGFAAATVQAVARQAGVGATAIYRRWPSRVELIEAAIFPSLDALAVTPTGDIAADLGDFVTAYRRVFATPAARAALPGLLAAYQAEPERHRALAQRIGQDIRPAFHATLAAAAPGTVDPAVNPDTVLDLLIGAALYRTFVHPYTGREEPHDDITEALLRALRPTGKALRMRRHEVRP